MELISVVEAAAKLGVTRERVGVLIRAGRLKAIKVGRVYVIQSRALEAVKVRKPGRPKTKKP